MSADLTTQLEPSTLPIAPGQIIGGRYLVGEVLGGGGMGVVCAATHVLLGTPVAIKLIHSELKGDAEAVQRFVNEARATAALKGEHIARVFDVGQLESGEPYLVMEQLEGLSLDQYLSERGALAVSEAVEIVLQVCDGLAEAHGAGLVHRDIKPANLFLARRPDGQFSLKILDFGIAKHRMHPNTPKLTDPGKSLGSPWYMSPEQMMKPASVDERADVWSIGVLLFELLTKQVPFDGETVPQVCANVLTASPPLPSECRPDVTTELDGLVLHCLEKEPNRRFGSVGELAQALMPFAATPVPSVSPSVSPSASPPRDSAANAELDFAPYLPAPRRAWPFVVALVALAALVGGGLLQYRDPGLVRRVIDASRVDLSSTPLLASTSDDTVPDRAREAPLLLQYLRMARAFPEAQRREPTNWVEWAPPSPTRVAMPSSPAPEVTDAPVAPPPSSQAPVVIVPSPVQERPEGTRPSPRVRGPQTVEDRYGL